MTEVCETLLKCASNDDLSTAANEKNKCYHRIRPSICSYTNISSILVKYLCNSISHTDKRVALWGKDKTSFPSNKFVFLLSFVLSWGLCQHNWKSFHFNMVLETKLDILIIWLYFFHFARFKWAIMGLEFWTNLQWDRKVLIHNCHKISTNLIVK